MSASATSDTTSSVRIRESPPDEWPRLAPCLSTVFASRPVSCHAGANAAMAPAAMASVAVKASTSPSTRTSLARGRPVPNAAIEHIDAVVGGGESRHAAADAEQHALGEQLLNHPPPSGAQRDANRNFPGAGVRADEHQVGKVGAGNRAGPARPPQARPSTRSWALATRSSCSGTTSAPQSLLSAGYCEREAIGDRRQIGLGALDADARLELRDAAIVVIAADRAVFG